MKNTRTTMPTIEELMDDTSISGSQASQQMREMFPPGQSRMAQESQDNSSQAGSMTGQSSLNLGQRLKLEIEKYSSILLAKNNQVNEDPGVGRILDHLYKDQAKKNILKDKAILKPQLLAGYCFLMDVPLMEGKIKFKSMKADELLDEIVIKYNLHKPAHCRGCNKIYTCLNNDIGDNCVLCCKSLCPNCCPKSNEEAGYLKTLFPICTDCSTPLLENRAFGGASASLTTVEPIKSVETHNTSFGSIFGNNLNSTIIPSPGSKKPEHTKKPNLDASKSENICKFFIRRACVHVKNKTECKWKHPKICFQWVGKGKGTCSREDCQFYHPKLCNTSKEGKKCERDKCKFYHVNIPREAKVNKDFQEQRKTIPPERQTVRPSVLQEVINVTPVTQEVQTITPVTQATSVAQVKETGLENVHRALESITEQLKLLTRESQDRKIWEAKINTLISQPSPWIQPRFQTVL